MSDDSTLVYDDESRADPTIIKLHGIDRLNITSLKAFEISTDLKVYHFEADSAATQKKWLEALKIAIKRAHGNINIISDFRYRSEKINRTMIRLFADPPFCNRIELDRRKKAESKSREKCFEKSQKPPSPTLKSTRQLNRS